MVAAEKLVIYIIALLAAAALFFIFYSPEGALDKVQDAAGGIKDYLPELGSDEIKAGQPSIPANQKEAILKLNETIDKMLKVKNTNCLMDYGGFPNLGVNSLEMRYTGSSTEFTVYGGAGGKQILTDLGFEIKGMIPCVIAGTEEIVGNFVKMRIDGEEISGDYYNSVGWIKIAFDESGFNENRIDFGAGFIDFEGQGWLFTPDNKHICFFPTVDAHLFFSYDANGINDDLVEEFSGINECD